jgi:hypothetical protein
MVTSIEFRTEKILGVGKYKMVEIESDATI